MEEDKIVIDASIVVKWFLEELYSPQALILRDRYIARKVTLNAPNIMLYEALNALLRSRTFKADELLEICDSLNKYGFRLHELEGELKKSAVKIAAQNNITIYDASYVALASKLNTKLYTADKDLLKRFPELTVDISSYRG